jgi:heme/copper-type cytochrome/quinol oxidase subunit 4
MMAEEKPKDREEQKSAAFELGGTVLLGLLVLTAAEYAFGVWGVSLVALFIVALIKGGMILNYFMHVTRLWSEEDGH